jgi:hypothetical protein
LRDWALTQRFSIFPVWRSQRWKDIHSIALAKICERLKVKKLIFGSRGLFLDELPVYFDRLAKHAGGRKTILSSGLELIEDVFYPFLPHLREIKIDFEDECPSFRDLLRNSCTKRLTIDTTHQGNREESQILNEVDGFSQKLTKGTFDYNFHLRELYFDFAWERDVPFKLNRNGISKFNCTEQALKVEEHLERNRVGWAKCEQAVILLLGLRRRRRGSAMSYLGQDVLSILVTMVWETRGTRVWIPKKTNSSME